MTNYVSPKKTPMDFTLQDFYKGRGPGLRILSKQHMTEMKAVAVYNAQKQWNTSIQRTERQKIHQDKTIEPQLVDAKNGSNSAAIPIMYPIKSRTLSALSHVSDASMAPTERHTPYNRELDLILKE